MSTLANFLAPAILMLRNIAKTAIYLLVWMLGCVAAFVFLLWSAGRLAYRTIFFSEPMLVPAGMAQDDEPECSSGDPRNRRCA